MSSLLTVDSKQSTVTKGGFTLVELLVAFGIFSILGTITISILFTTLRSGKKSDVLIVLKQNGNTAMSQIVRNIRYAKSLDSPSTCTSTVNTTSISITSSADDGRTTYSCTGGRYPSIASNGASLIDQNNIRVTDCSFTCSQATLNDPPTISLVFKLNARSPAGIIESSGSIPFQTSVTLRNINN